MATGSATESAAPGSNRQTSRPQGAVTLDPAGHTTAQAGFTYTWDGAGRLKTVRLSGTLLATYHYDARHRRTRKETTASAPQTVATVLYAYDQADHLIAETDASGPIRSYLWRDDTPVAQIEHRPSRNPLRFTDPDGLLPFFMIPGVSAVCEAVTAPAAISRG